MNLYLVHCGYYDKAVADGACECHANFFVAAGSFAEAKAKAKALPDFKGKRMHVDTLTRIDAVEGMAVKLRAAPELEGETVLVAHSAWARKAPD
jgi:hypothetical protein